MKKTWSEQHTLVTGGASGIGLAIAKKLHGLGVKVTLCDCDSTKLEQARESVGQNCRTVCVDVTDLKSVETAFAKHIEQAGAIHILVNSAGITGITNVRSHEVDPANVELVFRVNFFGSFNTARAVLPGMLRQNYGRILHIASHCRERRQCGNDGLFSLEGGGRRHDKSARQRIGRNRRHGERAGPSGHPHADGRSHAAGASSLHD